MRVVIIEDEPLQAKQLQKVLQRVDASIEVLAVLESVEDSVCWLGSNIAPDLIFMDIHLGDGNSFAIFDRVDVSAPVVFTTAYDEYALKAFSHFSVDYLLKPIDEAGVTRALAKFKRIQGHTSDISSMVQRVAEMLAAASPKNLKERFMVTIGTKIRSLRDDDIAYFMADDKLLMVFDRNGSRYFYSSTLAEIEPAVNPSKFFRLNRKFIAHIDSIVEVVTLSKSRLKVVLKPIPPDGDDIYVSAERSALLKKWMES
ncbi:MAG: response regulator transcription factor [Bacteroidales bacterium]|nr:response regulator transcription factor [Bacteroidales bacterium]MBN2749835.1 response regulator transcription factor [Bacteroidales bacterium]